MARERNIYIAIMRAADLGDGLRLSADEVAQLAFDDAIETHAAQCLDADDWLPRKPGEQLTTPKPWRTMDPYKKRKGSNLAL